MGTERCQRREDKSTNNVNRQTHLNECFSFEIVNFSVSLFLLKSGAKLRLLGGFLSLLWFYFYFFSRNRVCLKSIFWLFFGCFMKENKGVVVA